MTRADLTEEVSRILETPRKEGDAIVVTMFDSIVRALRNLLVITAFACSRALFDGGLE